jgi:PAS domain S-box-containing protein
MVSKERPSQQDPVSPGLFPGTIDTKLLLSIFHASPNSVSIADLDGIIRIVNDRALSLFGHPDESDVIGKSIFTWISPGEHPRAKEELARLVKDGASISVTLNLLRRDGSTFVGEARSGIIRNNQNEPVLILFSVENRTAQLAHERALQAILKGTSSVIGDKFFRSFVQELSAALGVRYALIGRAVDDAPGSIRTLALSVDGAIQENITFSLEGTPAQETLNQEIVFISQGVASQYPHAPLLWSWQAEAYLGTALRSVTGQFKGIVMVAHDKPVHDSSIARSLITIFGARAAAEIGRLEADEGLRENERRLHSIIDNAPFGAHIYELSGDGHLIFAGYNRSAVTMLKVDHHTLVGKTIEEAWPPLATTPIPEAYRKVALGDGKYGDSGIHYESDGIDGSFEINAFQTAPNRMAVFFRDVTERKKSETALVAARDKAEEADRAKTALLNNLSHEFRTPITGILGMAATLRSQVDDPALREAIAGITASGQRLHYTLDVILKLGQLASGNIQPSMKPVDIAATVDRAAARFRPMAEAKGVALQVQHNEGTSTLRSDDQILNDIISYLLDNAVKYTYQGAITIRCGRRTDGPVPCCAIDVEDTGIGISPAHQETIFREFRQLSEGYGRGYEGSGLGLTVAKRMAELLGGTLSVTSQPGAGSTFSVLLPLTAETTVEPVARQEPIERSVRSPRTGMPEVLIVEDNFINKAVIADFLKHMCTTDHARDGRTAIRMAQQKHYDAVLMDINLGPGLDGIETTKVIRQMQGYQNTPIVAVTGYTLPGERDRLLSEGLTHYIPKPFDQREIQEMVKSLLL